MAKKGNEKKEDASLPVVTALSLVRGIGGWQVLTLKVQGDKVLSVDATNPDMRAIALEQFRIKASKEFVP